MTHQAVMLNEVIEGLDIQAEGIYVDATYGRGGHSREILKHLTTGFLYVFDQDQAALENAYELQNQFPKQLKVIPQNFESLSFALKELGVVGIDGILFDLGVSSPQFDVGDRGFSYRYDGRLDMRMDQNQVLDAYQVVNTYPFERLVAVFRNYGEEPYAKQIARKIEQRRISHPIVNTLDLVDVIKSALPSKILSQKGHPAKQVFMALRIEVNRELEVLQSALEQAIDLLNPKGRLAVISFHSLEDRIVKRSFSKHTQSTLPSKLPIKGEELMAYRLLSKRAFIPTEKEQKENSRAHSSKLRILIKN